MKQSKANQVKNDMKKQEEIAEARSLVLFRVATDEAGKPQEERLYTPKADGLSDTLENLSAALKNSFDILVVHDPLDGCLVVNMMLAKAKIGDLPCKLHPRKEQKV